MKKKFAQLSLFGDSEASDDEASAAVAAATRPEEVHVLAERLPRSVRLGTSSWSFPGWKDIVYRDALSVDALAKRGLTAYSQHPLLRTVGVDRGFYAPISEETFALWNRQTPKDFSFVVKAPESLALVRHPHHPRYGALRGTPNPLYLDAGFAMDSVIGPASSGLGQKLAAVLFQFPPQLSHELGGPDGFADAIAEFAAKLPRGPAYAFEVRTAALLTPRYAERLQQSGGTHVYNVWSNMPRPEAQAQIIDPRTMPRLIVRWMLPTHLTYEDAKNAYAPFSALVAPDLGARRGIADLIRTVRELGKDVHVVINNKAEGSSPLSVEDLARELVSSGS